LKWEKVRCPHRFTGAVIRGISTAYNFAKKEGWLSKTIL